MSYSRHNTLHYCRLETKTRNYTAPQKLLLEATQSVAEFMGKAQEHLKNSQDQSFGIAGSSGKYPNVAYYNYKPVLEAYVARGRKAIGIILKSNPALNTLWKQYRSSRTQAGEEGSQMRAHRFNPEAADKGRTDKYGRNTLPEIGPHTKDITDDLRGWLIMMEHVKWVEKLLAKSSTISTKQTKQLVIAMGHIRRLIKMAGS